MKAWIESVEKGEISSVEVVCRHRSPTGTNKRDDTSQIKTVRHSIENAKSSLPVPYSTHSKLLKFRTIVVINTTLKAIQKNLDLRHNHYRIYLQIINNDYNNDSDEQKYFEGYKYCSE